MRRPGLGRLDTRPGDCRGRDQQPARRRENVSTACSPGASNSQISTCRTSTAAACSLQGAPATAQPASRRSIRLERGVEPARLRREATDEEQLAEPVAGIVCLDRRVIRRAQGGRARRRDVARVGEGQVLDLPKREEDHVVAGSPPGEVHVPLLDRADRERRRRAATREPAVRAEHDVRRHELIGDEAFDLPRNAGSADRCGTSLDRRTATRPWIDATRGVWMREGEERPARQGPLTRPEVSTASRSSPVNRSSSWSTSSSKRGSLAPDTYQDEPLSARIIP